MSEAEKGRSNPVDLAASAARRCTCDYYGPSEECALHGYCAFKGHPPAGEWDGVVVCHCGDPVTEVNRG